ncbi:MAG: SpoIID/LytB domain-containing protein [Candidatus Rokubacteria bacterium]|nr:SpoIID/LytB domain-containing protein [Candidatus Rokubacteria bacterium]
MGGGPLAVRDLRGRPLLDAPPSWLRVAERGDGIEARGARGGVRAPGLRVSSAAGRSVRVNARDYPGVIEISRMADGLVAVNVVPFEEYLVGAIKAEAGDRAPLEMLKAQAIVARTYAAYHRRLHASKPFHILASTAHQQYLGSVAADSPAWIAARETAGQVLLWEGALFPAFYHTDSGGHTEDPRVVFAAQGMPALRPVRVDFASDSPHQTWRLDVPLDALDGFLRAGGVSVGYVVGLEVLERSASLRVNRIAVHGTQGSAELRGNDFRRLVGYDTLKSTLFAVAVDGTVARFAGRGYGHGVGMDQARASTMAAQGYRALEILAFYYPGATLGRLP